MTRRVPKRLTCARCGSFELTSPSFLVEWCPAEHRADQLPVEPRVQHEWWLQLPDGQQRRSRRSDQSVHWLSVRLRRWRLHLGLRKCYSGVPECAFSDRSLTSIEFYRTATCRTGRRQIAPPLPSASSPARTPKQSNMRLVASLMLLIFDDRDVTHCTVTLPVIAPCTVICIGPSCFLNCA